MKKILTLLMTVLLTLCGFASCKDDTESAKSYSRKYITHFDGYNQCIIFPAVTWDTTLHDGGKVINDWNVDKGFVSEGAGSIKVSVNEKASDDTYWYKGRIEANNGFVSSITDLNGATEISLDVCNPNNVTIEVTIEIESASATMISVTKSCLPRQWTTVSTIIEENDYDIVNWYSITLKNTTNKEPFTVYMDNFHIIFED